MPAPLAMPLMVTFALPMRACAVATLGNVSVVMIAHARRKNRRRSPVRSALHFRRELVASSGSPITPVEARKISDGFATGHLGGEVGGQLGGRAAALAGEGVGVAGVDHQGAGFAAFEMRAAHSTGAEWAFRFGEHPAVAVPHRTAPASTSVRPA